MYKKLTIDTFRASKEQEIGGRSPKILKLFMGLECWVFSYTKEKVML